MSGDITLLHRRRRSELIFLCVFLGCTILIPLTFEKIIPFDRPSFFIASVRQHCVYKVTDPNGRALPLHEFGLGDFYFGQRGWFSEVPFQERGALELPESINIFGDVASEEQVRTVVKRHLTGRDLEYVDVSQKIKAGPGGKSVNVVTAHEWRVTNTPSGEP